MPAVPDRHSGTNRQEAITSIVVVGIGFVITLVGSYADASLPFSALQAVIAILLGIVYLVLLLRSDTYFERFPSSPGKFIYFCGQLLLVMAIQFLLLGPGTWLIPLPLVGAAVERLSGKGRWIVYLSIIFGLSLPLGLRTGDWSNAVSAPLFLVPAVAFSAIVTQLRLNDRALRKQSEAISEELEKANHQLSRYAVQVEELATTQERNRLAREIHDSLGHYLTAANVQLEAARAVIQTDTARAVDAISKAQQLTKEGLHAVRESVAALRDSPVGGQTLPDALKMLLDELRATGIVTSFHLQGEHRSLNANPKLTLYRVMQEGLTNVRKHARASRVDVTLDYQRDGRVRLQMKDNGVGAAMTSTTGFGMIGMRERVELLNGELRFDTAPGRGFLLEATVPG